MSSSTLRRIDDQLSRLDPHSQRHRVLVALRRFRASWVELGRLLTEVSAGGDYREWGFDSFEVYCARELGLKKPTVAKLIASYRYMQRHAGERLAAFDEDAQNEREDAPPPDVPDYQTVDLLRKLRERDDIDEGEKNQFHRLAFDEGAEETALRKEIRSALAPREEGETAENARTRELDEIRRTAKALRRKLADSRNVPQGLRDRFERLLAELEALE